MFVLERMRCELVRLKREKKNKFSDEIKSWDKGFVSNALELAKPTHNISRICFQFNEYETVKI